MHVYDTVIRVSFTQLCNFNAKMTLVDLTLPLPLPLTLAHNKYISNNVIFALKIT